MGFFSLSLVHASHRFWKSLSSHVIGAIPLTSHSRYKQYNTMTANFKSAQGGVNTKHCSKAEVT